MTESAHDVLAQQEAAVPDGVIGFGVAEMALLVSRYAGAGKQEALDLLRLSSEFVDQPVTVAGASSLVARGLADVEPTETTEHGDTVTLTGPAALLSYCFTNAVRWTAMSVIRGQHSDAAFFIQTPTRSVLLQPRAMGTWFVGFPVPERAAAEFLAGLVRENTDLDPEHAVYFGTHTARTRDNVFVRRLGASRWAVAEVRDEGAPVHRSEVDDAGLVCELVRIAEVSDR